jgi:hypothetical protein
VVIVDAGGGTIDISSYSRNQTESFEEIAAPQCSFIFFTTLKTSAHYIPGYFHGSVFVTFHAREFLEGMSCRNGSIISLVISSACLDHLSDSPFLDDLDHIIRCFDKTTKLRFRKAEEPEYVKFGSTRDNDESCNIRFGQLKLMG